MGRMGGLEWLVLILIVIFVCYLFKPKASKREEYRESEIDRSINNSEKLISHSLKKAKKYVEKKISLSYLTGCIWIQQNIESNIQYTFRTNGELLITVRGIVQKCKYELIVDNNSILITKNEITELYNIVNVENDFLYLNRVSNNEVLIFLNQTKIKDGVKQIIQNNY